MRGLKACFMLLESWFLVLAALRLLIHLAGGIDRHGGVALIHGMGEEVVEDLVGDSLAHRFLSANNDGTGAARIVLHVDGGDQAAVLPWGSLAASMFTIGQ